MTTVVTLDEFRKNLSDIVGSVMYGNQTVRVQKHGKAGVVVISEEEYEDLRNSQKSLAQKKEKDTLFVLRDKIRNRMSEKDQEEIEKIIDEEVKAVRAQK